MEVKFKEGKQYSYLLIKPIWNDETQRIAIRIDNKTKKCALTLRTIPDETTLTKNYWQQYEKEEMM